MQGVLNLSDNDKAAVYKEQAHQLFHFIRELKITRSQGVGWGYNFDWQSKAFFVPEGTPNVVTSVYVGHALLEYAQRFDAEDARALAEGIKDFILNEMILVEDDNKACFAYIPGEQAEVHNASLLAAGYLSRLHKDKPEERLKSLILKAADYAVEDINEEGYWPYGKMAHHRWMDNFHTAFNLEALLDIRQNLNTDRFDYTIGKVFDFYVNHFFTDDGIPKYYSQKVYPIDAHTIAESLIFLSKVPANADGLFSTEQKNKAQNVRDAVLNYALNHFWDKRGYFYYRKGKFIFNKIPYIRWSQAWMFYALTCCEKQTQKAGVL